MRWHHFEDYDQPISCFVAVGDSAWCFYPHYAQRMTVALASARALGQVIDKDPTPASLPKRYYAHAKKLAGTQWGSSAQLDLLWSGTLGKRPWHLRLLRPFVVYAAACAAANSCRSAPAQLQPWRRRMQRGRLGVRAARTPSPSPQPRFLRPRCMLVRVSK